MSVKEKEVQKGSQIERVLTVWGLIVVLWSIFRANFGAPLWLSEFLIKPLIFLVPVIFFVQKYIQGGSLLKKLGFPEKRIAEELFLSVSLLFVVFGAGMVMLLMNKQPFLLFLNSISFAKASYVFGLSIATATVEEVVGRGFMFNYLNKFSKNFVMSMFVSSTLFFVLYLPGALTMHVSGPALFVNLLMNFLLSFMAATLFYVRRNVLVAIGFHAGVLLWFDLLLGV
ncbi:MAG: CPBP family intramembrane glutamic endopeptidase [Patescibacteria group bacterium]|jgi:membrane protease YdiL (CAAX protease family)